MEELWNGVTKVKTVICQTFDGINRLFHTKPRMNYMNKADAVVPPRPYMRTNFVNQQGVVA